MSFLLPVGGVTLDVPDVTITHKATSVSASNLTTYTFSGLALGSVSAGRRIAVCIGLEGSSEDVSSCTVDGDSMVHAVSLIAYNGNKVIEIWEGVSADNTTGDVVVVAATGCDGAGVIVYEILNAGGTASYTATATTNENDPSLVITHAAGGSTLGFWSNNTSISAVTWTGLTEDVNRTTWGDSHVFESASSDFASAETNRAVATDESGANSGGAALIAASWSK